MRYSLANLNILHQIDPQEKASTNQFQSDFLGQKVNDFLIIQGVKKEGPKGLDYYTAKNGFWGLNKGSS